MLHMTRLGWMWDAPRKVRLESEIPDELILSKNDVLEIFPKYIQVLEVDKNLELIRATIDHHNEWCRRYGIGIWFKKDGYWFCNYPRSTLTASNNAVCPLSKKKGGQT